jgi:tRNA threonylcarbamoyladenosine biosynthesis protein TsaB
MTNRSTSNGIDHTPILALESGSRACSAAVWRAGAIVASETIETDHGQATLLMPMIERVMARSGHAYPALGRIAVAVGPGSFTGLRVGLAAALGLSLACGAPAIGISSFQAAAAGLEPDLRGDGRLFVVLDSRRDEPFLAELDRDLEFVGAPMVAGAEQVRARLAAAGRAVVTGDAPLLAAGGFPPEIVVEPNPPHAFAVARLAAEPERRFDLPPQPVYLRAPDVTVSKSA